MWAALCVVFAFCVLFFVTAVNFLVEHFYVAGPVTVALFAFAVFALTAPSSGLRSLRARR